MPIRPPEVGPARLLAAMLGDLGVSTPCPVKTMTQLSSLCLASNQPCCLLQCSGTTLRVRLRRPLVLLVVLTCWKTYFSSRHYSTYFFFSSLLFWIIIPAILPAMMLRYYSMSASSMPSEIFSLSFRSIGSLLPIGRHSTSFHSARLQTGRLLS
jgi:hypothetical protein